MKSYGASRAPRGQTVVHDVGILQQIRADVCRDPVLVSQRLSDEPRCAPVGFAIERVKAPRESEVDVVVE
jgi:hypothetical protein